MVGQRRVLGMPLAQVFSINIKPDNDVCEIYGTIEVVDESGELYLYNRDLNDAETIHNYGTISLISFTDRPIAATADFTIKLDLKEKNMNGDIEFINESFTWNGPNLFSYFNCLSHDFRGKLGLATMYFGVFSVAVDATFGFFPNKYFTSGDVNVYGKIVAYYGRNFNCLVEENLKHYFRFILFDRTSEEAVDLKQGQLLPLLRESVCVPAYSSLVLEVELYYTDSSGDTERSMNYKDDLPAWEDSLDVERDDAFVITVDWKHPMRFMRFPSLETVRIERFNIKGYTMLELFSARIFYDQTIADEGNVEVYGAIRVNDGRNDMSLFSFRKNCSSLSPDGTLALTGPTCAIRGSHFSVSLDVKEKHQKFVLDGLFNLNPSYNWDWSGCFACVALVGKDCYGVLHFAIFDYAVQANVEVTLFSHENTTLHGSLVAYYENYEYKSDYVKTYFQTRLLDVPVDKPINVLVNPTSTSFVSSLSSDMLEGELMSENAVDAISSNAIENEMMPEYEDKAVELKHKSAVIEGKAISLSRNVVAVPDNSSLVIEANLSTRIDVSETLTQLVKGSATFQPQNCGVTSAKIGDKDIFIDIKVSWFNDPYTTPGKLPFEIKRHSSVEEEVLSYDKKGKFN